MAKQKKQQNTKRIPPIQQIPRKKNMTSQPWKT